MQWDTQLSRVGPAKILGTAHAISNRYCSVQILRGAGYSGGYRGACNTPRDQKRNPRDPTRCLQFTFTASGGFKRTKKFFKRIPLHSIPFHSRSFSARTNLLLLLFNILFFSVAHIPLSFLFFNLFLLKIVISQVFEFQGALQWVVELLERQFSCKWTIWKCQNIYFGGWNMNFVNIMLTNALI